MPEWNARRCIDWIETHNLFVTALDSRREWYRYHQMFRSVLLERALAELGPERVSDLQRRAANWFATAWIDRRSGVTCAGSRRS